MTTVKDVLIYEALEANKKRKEEKKQKRLADKVNDKIIKWRVKQANTVAKIKIKSVKVLWGIKTPKTKKQNETTLKKKKRKELLLRAKKVVYARDKDICQHCDKKCIWSDRHASHVIPVSSGGRLALYPLNMKVLCYHCHLNRRHKHPTESWLWFAEKFPERLKELQELQRNMPIWSITITELEEIEKIIEEQEKLYLENVN